MCQQPLPAQVIRSTGKTDLLPRGQGHRAELGRGTKPGSPGDSQCQLGASNLVPMTGMPGAGTALDFDLVQQAQESHETKGHNCCRVQLGFTVQGPCGRTVEGEEGNLLSLLGCHKKGDGQLEVLTLWLAGLSVPPMLPSINGATQVRN